MSSWIPRPQNLDPSASSGQALHLADENQSAGTSALGHPRPPTHSLAVTQIRDAVINDPAYYNGRQLPRYVT